MEDAQKIIIPTLSKSKISHHLSYPIGAELLSESLSTVPQFGRLKLHFYSRFNIGLRSGHYEFIRVEYLNNATPASEWPIRQLHNRPPQYRWEIVVQPVPRILRRHVRQYILEVASGQIAKWLTERSELIQQGSDILAFFFDEKSEQFKSESLSHLDPIRVP